MLIPARFATNKNLPAPPVTKTGWPFWLVIVTIASGISGFLSFQSLYGVWLNSVCGHPFWAEYDPAGFYVASAHQIQDNLSVGHPGLPLTYALWAVQKLLFVIDHDPGASFTFSAVKHLSAVFLAGKLLITFFHLFPFYLLYLFSKEILGSGRASQNELPRSKLRGIGRISSCRTRSGIQSFFFWIPAFAGMTRPRQAAGNEP